MNTSTSTTLPIPPDLFRAIAGLGGCALLVLIIYGVLSIPGHNHVAPLERVKERLGMGALNSGLFLIALTLWGAIFLSLSIGLIWLIWEMIWMGVLEATRATWDFRFALARIAGLTATLGAVVALPFTLVRVRLNAEQTATAADTLFNDKINAASEGLHAMRQRWDDDVKENIWEPDILRRHTAIDRLRGLAAVKPEETLRIAKLLNVYIRQQSRDVPISTPPKSTSSDKLREFYQNSASNRTDVEAALRALGQLRPLRRTKEDSILLELGFPLGPRRVEDNEPASPLFPGDVIDLIGVNLQGFDLCHLNLTGFQLGHAALHGANLTGSDLSSASLFNAIILEANLLRTRLRGTLLFSIVVNEGTALIDADLRGAGFQNSDLSSVHMRKDQIDHLFGDASVTLPEKIHVRHPDWPSHFDTRHLQRQEYVHCWRAFQRNIGFDPDDPSTW